MKAVVDADMESLSTLGIPTEDVRVYAVNNGRASYSYQITDAVTAIYSVAKDESGTITLDITEGDLHDVVKKTSDGTLYVNGAKIDGPAPRMGNMDYQSKPYGNARDYTDYVRQQSNPNVPLTKAIVDFTISALCLVVATSLGLPDMFSDLLATTVSSLIDAARTERPGSTSYSYKKNIYARNDSMGTDRYERYEVYCYAGPNYTGTVSVGVYYGHYYFT